MTFDLARNTKEAEDYLKQTRYAVVISDFYRTDDPIGGYTLLEAVKRIPNAPPYIIYSGSARPDLVGEAKAKGAFGETNNPQQLFDMVMLSKAGERHRRGGPTRRSTRPRPRASSGGVETSR